MSPDELMFRPGLMKGEHVLVTGGGTGLGRVMAEAALALGADVAIAGRRKSVLDAAAKEMVDAHGGRVTPLVCDIRDPDSIDAMLDVLWQGGTPPTALINNAAGNFISRTEDLSPRGFDAIASTVFKGSFLVTQGCGRRWIRDGAPGSVVSIVTTWIWNGSPFVLPSAMSKAGIAAMTRSLAVEWGGKGIRLNAIAPGIFPTEGALARLRPGDDEDEGYWDPSQNPMGRVGQMPELANLAIYLLHPGSAYINGQVIAIDGGQQLATGGNFSSLRAWSDQDWEVAGQRIRAADAKDRSLRSS